MRNALWIIFLATIAVISIFAQIDRHSRISPAIAHYVPDRFASFALQQRTRAALVERDAAAATKAASALVAERPMPAGNLRMLAQARAIAEDEIGAAAAIQLAARRGWRDTTTQRAMLEMALDAGDHREAARRLAALWAQSQDRSLFEPLAGRVLAHEDARAEMARLINEEPRWQASYLRIAPDILDQEIHRDIERRRRDIRAN